MAKFSVIAKNEMIEQINNIDDCQYAFEMYRYLTVEMGFPDVKIVDCETGVVLMYFKKETTTYEYVDPDILASISEQTVEVDVDEAINLADAPIDTDGIDEETALSNHHDLLRKKCMEKINAILATAQISLDMRITLKSIYDNVALDKYTTVRLEELAKTLEIS